MNDLRDSSATAASNRDPMEAIVHASVRSYFIRFNEPIEARVAYMYLDIKGLVTIGVGNLIDVEKADDANGLEKVRKELVKLPFVYKTGRLDAGKPAGVEAIWAEWKKVKAKQDWAQLRDGYRKFGGFTDLRLSDDAIDTLVTSKLHAMERELTHVPAFWDFRKWPADAQLGLLSMVWALGVPKLRMGWPNFRSACKKQDFDGAAKRCTIRSADNPGVIPRNRANEHLFKNAAAVLANDGPNAAQNAVTRATLYYPGMLMKPMVIKA